MISKRKLMKNLYQFTKWKKYCTKCRRVFFKSIVIVIFIGFCILNAVYKRKLEQRCNGRLSGLPIEDEKGTSCTIPKMNPFSKNVMPSQKVLKFECPGENWVDCRLTQCHILPAVLSKFTNVSCDFKDIIYVSDKWFYLDDPTTVQGNENYVFYNSDFVKVECIGFHKNSSISRWTGYKAGFRPVRKERIPKERKNTPNFMILCLNSISHNEFIRSMPKSLKVLTKELGAVILNGFHVVGGKSPANLSPLLTGKAASELPNIDQFYFADHVDPAMFIFNSMKQDGYRTAFYKDMPWRGTFLNSHKGFSRQPADHYICPFLMKHYVDNLKSKGNIFCIGDVPHYSMMLNLTKQFFELYGKKFSLNYITDISPEKLGLVPSIDDDVASYLRWFKYTGKLDNTVIIVMSDRGMRFGPQRATEQGRIEERLPFLSIILPKTVQKLRPTALLNLKSNVDVLTTTYDVYDTILDIVELDAYRSNYTVPGADKLRAMSLLEPIPKNRSCSEADIAPYWCVCNEWKAVSRNEPIYHRIVSELVEHVNGVIKQFPTLCSKRDLLHVEWVKRRNPKHMAYSLKDLSLTNKTKLFRQYRGPYLEYYQVKIVMGPKTAVYEGAVNYSVENDTLTINENDVTRVNLYGEEPNCINEGYPHLNEYCLCKAQ